jgi:hypothetical protein
MKHQGQATSEKISIFMPSELWDQGGLHRPETQRVLTAEHSAEYRSAGAHSGPGIYVFLKLKKRPK